MRFILLFIALLGAVQAQFSTVTFQSLVSFDALYSSQKFSALSDQLCSSIVQVIPAVNSSRCWITSLDISVPQVRNIDPSKPFQSEFFNVEVLLIDATNSSASLASSLASAINGGQIRSPLSASSASVSTANLVLCDTLPTNVSRISYRRECGSLPQLEDQIIPFDNDHRVYVSNIGLAIGILLALLALGIFALVVFVSWYGNVHRQRQQHYNVLGEEMFVTICHTT